MITFCRTGKMMLSVLLAWTCSAMYAQENGADEVYTPRPGQDGKDVIWLPTPQPLIETMLTVAKVSPGDFLIDLGSGDGRAVITSARRGARGRGIEYNPDMVEYSRKLAEDEGVSDMVEFVQGDLFEADLSEATVITMFLLPSINAKLAPSFLKLKPGTRIVSNSFGMGEWIPDDTAHSPKPCRTYCDALLWIVPANVEGIWLLPDGEMTLHQKYQVISGTISSGGRTTKIFEGKLCGDQITFKAGLREFTGRVYGNHIEGVKISNHNHVLWRGDRCSQ
ncbi:MAG: class I SAM-dependent methyltransferase [Bacteroidales bacterium]|nr:class I SAM-dependent methyltransferase [Bacteroidales bacterium]